MGPSKFWHAIGVFWPLLERMYLRLRSSRSSRGFAHELVRMYDRALRPHARWLALDLFAPEEGRGRRAAQPRNPRRSEGGKSIERVTSCCQIQCSTNSDILSRLIVAVYPFDAKSVGLTY